MCEHRGKIAVFMLATALGACGGGAVSEHLTLSGSIEPLRAAFDADSGKVRAIFLASPT